MGWDYLAHEYIRYENCDLRKVNTEEIYSQHVHFQDIYAQDVIGLEVAKLGALIGNRFYYMVVKRQTKKNVQAMRQAELNLYFLGERVNSTPEWNEPEVVPKSGPSNRGTSDTFTNHFSAMTVEDRPRHIVPEQSEPKVKTRGVTAAGSDNEKKKVEVEPKPTVIEVDQRTADVVEALFSSPGVSGGHAGTVRWVEFLGAMTAIGFQAEKLYGSVWLFTPGPQLGLSQALQVHEPHPSPNMSYLKARQIGRRMNRRYGWGGETFVRKG